MLMTDSSTDGAMEIKAQWTPSCRLVPRLVAVVQSEGC